jgi:hypothetical protein
MGIFEKLGVSNRIELVLSCLRQEQLFRKKQCTLTVGLACHSAPINMAMRSSTMNSGKFTHPGRSDWEAPQLAT